MLPDDPALSFLGSPASIDPIPRPADRVAALDGYFRAALASPRPGRQSSAPPVVSDAPPLLPEAGCSETGVSASDGLGLTVTPNNEVTRTGRDLRIRLRKDHRSRAVLELFAQKGRDEATENEIFEALGFETNSRNEARATYCKRMSTKLTQVKRRYLHPLGLHIEAIGGKRWQLQERQEHADRHA